MKKQVLNEEFKRMQKLAGIIKENKTIDNAYMYQTFKDLDLDIDNIKEEGGLESGGDDWMEIISYITGKDAYDSDSLTAEDHSLIQKFISVMGKNGLKLY